MVDLTAHLVFRFLPDTPGSTVVAPLALLEVEPGPKHAQHGRSTFVSLLGLVLPAIRSLPSFLARTCTLCCSSRPPTARDRDACDPRCASKLSTSRRGKPVLWRFERQPRFLHFFLGFSFSFFQAPFRMRWVGSVQSGDRRGQSRRRPGSILG